MVAHAGTLAHTKRSRGVLTASHARRSALQCPVAPVAVACHRFATCCVHRHINAFVPPVSASCCPLKMEPFRRKHLRLNRGVVFDVRTTQLCMQPRRCGRDGRAQRAAPRADANGAREEARCSTGASGGEACGGAGRAEGNDAADIGEACVSGGRRCRGSTGRLAVLARRARHWRADDGARHGHCVRRRLRQRRRRRAWTGREACQGAWQQAAAPCTAPPPPPPRHQ